MGIIKLRDAPRDGTPFILLGNGEPEIVEYADFVKGWCAVEECDGGFFHVGSYDDFVATVPSNGDCDCVLLTEEQIAAIEASATPDQSPTQPSGQSPTTATD